MPEREDCIYAAGFFDGEGYIGLVACGKGRPRQLRVTASQIVPGPIEWLRERWGGAMTVNAYSRRPMFIWIASTRGALAFLEDIRPWLKVKGEQADVAIALQRSKNGAKNMRTHSEAAHLRLVELRASAGGSR